MHYLPFTQEAQGVEILRTIRQVHKMLVGGTGLLLCRHILYDVGYRVARCLNIRCREGDAVGVCGKYTVVVHRVKAEKSRRLQICTACALHALENHRSYHLPMCHFFGTYIVECCSYPVIGHGEPLGQITHGGRQLRVGTAVLRHQRFRHAKIRAGNVNGVF